MPTTKLVTLYKYAELSDAAKEKARQWFIDGESQDFGAHGELFEAAKTAAKLLGIEFDELSVPLMSGKTRNEPKIYWSLGSQGSGASFEARYTYTKCAAKAIKAEFGGETGETLAGIANELTRIQKRFIYGLTARVTQSGSYTHEYSMSVEAFDRHGKQVSEEIEKELLEVFRKFARWIHDGIDEDYAYRTSDEQAEEGIEANDYTFLKSGERED